MKEPWVWRHTVLAILYGHCYLDLIAASFYTVRLKDAFSESALTFDLRICLCVDSVFFVSPSIPVCVRRRCLTSRRLTGALSSRLLLELDRERFLTRNCWNTGGFFNTLASVKPATQTHAVISLQLSVSTCILYSLKNSNVTMKRLADHRWWTYTSIPHGSVSLEYFLIAFQIIKTTHFYVDCWMHSRFMVTVLCSMFSIIART